MPMILFVRSLDEILTKLSIEPPRFEFLEST